MSKKSKRGGRPKKSGDRYPSGGLRPVKDLGSPEALRNRALMVSPGLSAVALESIGFAAGASIDDMTKDKHDEFLAFIVAQKDAEDRRTAYPLGVLAARQLVTSRQHYAGRRYMQLYLGALQYGGANVKSCLANVVGDGSGGKGNGYGPEGGISDDPEPKEYRGARAVLKGVGRSAEEAVVWVAVFQRFPDVRDMNALKTGLSALAAHFDPFGGERKADVAPDEFDAMATKYADQMVKKLEAQT